MKLSKRAEQDLRTLFPLDIFGGMKEDYISWNITAYTPDWIEVQIIAPADITWNQFVAGILIKKEFNKYQVFISCKAELDVPLNWKEENYSGQKIKKFHATMTFEQLESNKNLIADVIASITMGAEKQQITAPLYKIFPRQLFNKWQIDSYKDDYIQARLSIWSKKTEGPAHEKYYSIQARLKKDKITASFYYHDFASPHATHISVDDATIDDPKLKEIREAIEEANAQALASISKRAAFSVAWTKPSLEHEKAELLRVAEEEGISYDSLIRSFNHGFLKPLDRKVWEHLENTDSLQVRTLPEAFQLAENYSRDPNRLLNMFYQNRKVEAPIVLERDDGSITLVSGNTRLAFARAYHVKPDVYWIKATELFQSPHYIDKES